ncbi:hypothetical protein CFC21_052423 [Triticum aestivum]|uniref:RNA helicase n=3 Tax=Triticum TaxID=4564 RepID=A0A9R0SCJ0_TRITD|nr:hypothetical protein CFC21_052423 [Triticum aestivum]VAH91664.1 unnamed protein product [Triticum turgidum subsp. durum]
MAAVSTHGRANKTVIYWDICGGDYIASSYIGTIERSKLLRILSYTLHTFQGNKDLSDVTHVIVDEVHERTILSNFLLIVLKSLVENALINQEES